MERPIPPNRDLILFFVPKNPEFEVIEVGEVEKRVRVALPGLGDPTYELLATVVVVWAPAPPELADFAAKAISALDGIDGFMGKAMPNELSHMSWVGQRNDVIQMLTALGMIRDRVERVCDHDVLEPAPAADERAKAISREAANLGMIIDGQPHTGRRQCTKCGCVWAEGEPKPERVFTSRPYLPKKFGGQRPGRGAFLHFVTELLRRPGQEKIEPLRIGAKLIELFWSDGREPYQDHQLEGAYREGKESARVNSLISASEFVALPRSRLGVESLLTWVPMRPGGTGGDGKVENKK